MPFVEFIAGWISGAVGLVVGHPLDTVKVRLQTQSVYGGILDCVIKTYTREGLHGFFKGMSFPVLSVAVSNAVAFGSYSNALDYLTQSHHNDHSQRSPLSYVFMAGCFSGLAQLFVTAPIDLVKVRLQNQTRSRSAGNKYRGPLHCVAVIVREDGLKGLFRGFWALALRDVPCYGLYFLPYEFTLRMMTEKGKQPGHCAVLAAGGVAGVITWACATPMDVVKARLQMSGGGGRVYSGVLNCITVSVREEGIRVFFKGLLLNSVRAFPVNAVTFLSYEMILRACVD
ncbi:solute carrier family 25 member 45 [Danio rerio]|uniref:Solute carrier family 25 member 45 n=3 Tax=Danio rerio TaxID=7955 RepID=A0AC58JMT3_DANRE|nr:solute carrier family 25 member 45 isoform X1 [Danio rerio]XP_021332364.1 solute carrier family 25 member 45 isoform X1 [Danio rerio]|eukprot:XP_002662242.1 solute carrier family 25 member 45 isoform X1 [Danio rerio]